MGLLQSLSFFGFSGGLFKNAEFYCRVKRRDQQFIQHRLVIWGVTSELECALECLIYGGRCRSYNFRYITNVPGELHICELNASSHSLTPERLVSMDGYQYCARI